MTEKLEDQISNWLKTYLTDNEMKCFVVGVSGGVDSAVTSTLCARTGIDTYVLNIPISSSEKNTSLSNAHCEWLLSKYPNVNFLNLDATSAFNSFEDIFRCLGRTSDLANANSKSRMRMMVLYYIASLNQGIVVGTGNKVEDFGVGFYTKYGDGGVDISPIAGLMKTQVRELAESMGVNSDIITAPPTDGLWEDSRTDEEQIGASYEELEWAMSYIESNTGSPLTEREAEVIRIYNSFHSRNLHKMKPIPVFKPASGVR